MGAIFEVEVVDRASGQARWVRVEATCGDEALSRVAAMGEIVGEYRLVDAIGSTPESRMTQSTDWRPNAVRIPLLISAIGNIVVGLIWASTCFGIVLTVPMVVLCIFEFQAYSLLRRPVPSARLGSVRTIQVIEIVLGLFNWISFVCGIVGMVNNAHVREQISARSHSASFCLSCGYDLRGLERGARCPECGTG